MPFFCFLFKKKILRRFLFTVEQTCVSTSLTFRSPVVFSVHPPLLYLQAINHWRKVVSEIIRQGKGIACRRGKEEMRAEAHGPRAFTKPPLLQRSRLTGSGNPLFESCVKELRLYTVISLCLAFPSTQLSKSGLPLHVSPFLWNRGGLVNGHGLFRGYGMAAD